MYLRRLIVVVYLISCISLVGYSEDQNSFSSASAQNAYDRLVTAEHWREARAACETLAGYGEEALPLVIKGTMHNKSRVRQFCYEIIYERFHSNPRTFDVMIRGLEDENSWISYLCAFHLGEHGIKQAAKPLKACIERSDRDELTRYAAAKSLAEIGDDSVAAMLYIGLGSDDHYTRHLSNIGIKALTGKDLTEFGYESPWEGAFVSGPNVAEFKGHPIEKAKRKLERWKAIVAFLEWLETEHPDLFKKLEEVW